VLAEASLTFPAPDGLSPEVAALTEPMAVALHAVRRSEIGRRDVAIVIGCGPIGLGVILHAEGAGRARRRRLRPVARALGAGREARGRAKHPVIFECVGAPGLIESVIDGAPLYSRVVVVGVCVEVDTFTPAMAINKEIDLRFVLAYTPLELRDTLRLLAEGTVDPRPLITDTVGLDGVADAFAALADPERQAKILIDPQTP
jgi:threonine dehydrogenase-like Zn-dependent dehydrogenase